MAHLNFRITTPVITAAPAMDSQCTQTDTLTVSYVTHGQLQLVLQPSNTTTRL